MGAYFCVEYYSKVGQGYNKNYFIQYTLNLTVYYVFICNKYKEMPIISHSSFVVSIIYKIKVIEIKYTSQLYTYLENVRI